MTPIPRQVHKSNRTRWTRLHSPTK